ncbi:MAG: LysM peptidoglycan-binding domain-containing protein [Deltaproteobacteria bacterium]|nr:MAG: LysM peptidoglycan-binding domain-containing protein [Deltaproteobacteria bacterium]
MEAHRIKLRGFFLPVLLLFFSCTHIHPLYKVSDSRDLKLNSSDNEILSGSERTENSAGINETKTPLPPTANPVEVAAATEASGSNDNALFTLSNAPIVAEKKVQPILDEALEYCQAAQEFWQKGELESAVEALDQAYALILNVNIDDQPKLIQQKDDLRFSISKRILEIYASRNIVVNGEHQAIPRVINRYVETEIERFIRGEEKIFFIESYKRSGRYRPLIESALIEAGLPSELSWLPLIESGFKVNAFSKARALGLWQFIPSTGYKFGLKRNKYIDERLDPEKSTGAAIAYLKELHQIFGDWTTVLAAYNCGEGRVLRVIRHQNINYLDNFWDLYERLPFETARYVPRFLATLHIINNLDLYGLDDIELDPLLQYETVEVSKQIHLKDVAQKIGVSLEVIKGLNPELRYKILPPDKYTLRVPPDMGEPLMAKITEIPVSSAPKPTFVYHRVRRGETLSTIARRYKTRVRSIMRANNLRRSNYIVAGRLLKIPQRGYEYRSPKRRNLVPKHGLTHTVVRGDSLWIIANRYGTTARKIQQLNNLTTTELYIGQILKLPQDVADSGGNGLKMYQVQQGDSPFEIAVRHKMPLDRLLRINSLTTRSTIYPGQKLYVE